jgi:glutaredoxin 3
MTKTNIRIYTKDKCPRCVRAKTLLASKEIAFEEVKVGADITREEFFVLFPKETTVPQIMFGQQHIRGYEQLLAYFKKMEQSEVNDVE